MKKIIRIIGFIAILVFIVVIMSGCSSRENTLDNIEAREICNFKKVFEDIDVGCGSYDDIFVDTTTNVLYFRDWRNGWTPLWNADGTLKTYDGYK